MNFKEIFEVVLFIYLLGRYEVMVELELNGFVLKFDSELKFDEFFLGVNKKYDIDKVFVDIFEENWLIVDDVKFIILFFRVCFFLWVFFRFGFDRIRILRSFGIYKDSVGERSRGRFDEFLVYGSRLNGLDVLKEVELVREWVVVREREVFLV